MASLSFYLFLILFAFVLTVLLFSSSNRLNQFKRLFGADIWGNDRLELALYLKENVFSKLNKIWFIENGTLLGAFRNEKFIPHDDDDFDTAMLIKNDNEIYDIYLKVKNELSKQSKWECRLITSYCYKIEIYDAKQGNNIYIQFYKETSRKNYYHSMYYVHNSIGMEDIYIDDIHPTKDIKLENELFPAPRHTKKFLIQLYGSLDPKAKYNTKTGKYELKIKNKN